jgi:hypothetical protein
LGGKVENNRNQNPRGKTHRVCLSTERQTRAGKHLQTQQVSNYSKFLISDWIQLAGKWMGSPKPSAKKGLSAKPGTPLEAPVSHPNSPGAPSLPAFRQGWARKH